MRHQIRQLRDGATVSPVRYFWTVFLTLVIFSSCHTKSPVFTPDPKDPAYHCHAADGSVIADAVWCFPVDQTRTCCPFEHKCSTLGGEQTCEFIGRPDQPTFAARKPAKRSSESGQ